MRWFAFTAVVLALGCLGTQSSDGGMGGGGGGVGVGGGGGGVPVCLPAGVWSLDYSNFTGGSGCSPGTELLVVAALPDGGFTASLGLHGLEACGGPLTEQDADSRVVTFDHSGCTLTINEQLLYCLSGESQCNDRDLTLHFNGDQVTGAGQGDSCFCQGNGPGSLAVSGQRIPSGNPGTGGGDGCAPAHFGACNPVGFWKVTYGTGFPPTCTPSPEVLAVSSDGGELDAELSLDRARRDAGSCGTGVVLPPAHRTTVFDSARCELTLTQDVAWCDAFDGGLRSDQRSVVLTFAADQGVGTGVAASSECGAQLQLCVGAARQ